MISRENYIRQQLDTVAAQAGAEWDAQEPAREAVMTAWREDVASILSAWESEVGAAKEADEEPPPRPELPPRPHFATRPEVMDAAMASDTTDHGEEWSKSPSAAAIAATIEARAAKLAALEAAKDSLDKASTVAGVRTAAAAAIAALEARLAALEGR